MPLICSPIFGGFNLIPKLNTEEGLGILADIILLAMLSDIGDVA